MAKDAKSKQGAPRSKGTPSESDRKVLEQSGEAAAADTPDVTNVDGGKKIRPVDLSLHGDGINHWQDEMPSRRNARRAREGKLPAEKKKK